LIALVRTVPDRGPLALPVPVASAGGKSAVSLLAFYDFPREDARGKELSGIVWDDARRSLWAIRDGAPQLVELRPSADWTRWSFGEQLDLTLPIEWDGEGIALTGTGGFFIANEFGPYLLELDARGGLVAQASLPAHFDRIRRNLSLESLSLTPDGRYLFTGNEAALEGDGALATLDAGTLTRIVRYDRVTTALVEFAYRTDPIFARGESGDRGMVEIAALSENDILVMERSFVAGVGNNVRIYRVSLAGASNAVAVENLAPDTRALAKTLLVDLTELPESGFPPPLQQQPHRALDNFEGLALGPRLPDGRRLLFVVSDDNARATQTPRILVLAVDGL